MEGTIFINEIGNFGRDDEYVELVVVGSTSNPTAPVNLEGYIIDDNDFSLTEVGNQPGHIRLGDCFKAVLPGSIILIYNHSPLVNPLFDNVNNPYSYLMQTKGACLIGCSYGEDQFNQVRDYNCSDALPVTDTRKYIPMRNIGDVLQVRNPEGDLVHAISWVDKYKEKSSTKTININIGTLVNSSVSNSCIYFNANNNWYSDDNFIVDHLTNASPGFPNNLENQLLISKIRNGGFSPMMRTSCSVKSQPTQLKNNDGQIAVTISGGVPPYAITVQGQIYNFESNQRHENIGTFIFSGLTENTYKIIVEDASSILCGQFLEIKLTKAKLICKGECTEIGSNSSTLCNFLWTETGNAEPTQKVCPEETTTYTQTAVDANGNIVQNNYTVEVRKVKINPNPSLICPGLTNVELSCVGTFSSYNWSTGETTPTIKVSKAKTYSVTVNDKDNDCVYTGEANVYDANNSADIKKFFIEKGFKQNTNVIITELPGRPNNPQNDSSSQRMPNDCFQNLANATLQETKVFNQFVDYSEEFKFFCESGHYDKVYVTENENFCEEHIQALTDFNLGTENVLWFHLFYDNVTGESILFFSDNQQPEEPDEWHDLTTADFNKYYALNNCISNISYIYRLGLSFEETFNAFAFNNYTATGNGNYYKNQTLYNSDLGLPSSIWPYGIPVYVRKTRPDGIYNGSFLSPNGQGVIWYEMKLVAGGTVLGIDYKNYQLSSHIWNLRCNNRNLIGNQPDKRKANFVVVTTSNVELGPDLVIEAHGLQGFGNGNPFESKTWVGLHRIKPKYRYTGLFPEINFIFDCPAVCLALLSGEYHPPNVFLGLPVFIQCP
jgi:hypothetical protein